MQRRPRTIVLVFAALIACASTARAQQDQQATSEFEAWQLPGWTVTPGVIVGELYDSNVALSTPAAGTSKTASDHLFAIEPYGQAEYNDHRTNFFSGYRGFINRYSTLSALDNVDQTAYVTLQRLLSRRVTVSASDYYLLAATTDQLELNGVPFLRTGSRYNQFTGTVDARLSRTMELSTRYDLTWASFDRNNTLLNGGGTVNGIRSDALRLVNERLGVGGEYTVRWASLNASTRALAFQEFGGVLRYRVAPTLTLEVAGGVGHLADFAQQLSRTGPYVRGELTDRLRRATLDVRYDRRYTPTLALGASNEAQEVSGYIEMPVTRRGFYVQSSALWRETNPILPGELPLASLWIRATAGYALQRWIRIEVYDSYAREDIRQATQPIFRTLAGVQLVLAQPVRIR